VSTGSQQPLTLERIQKLVDELASAYQDLLGGDSIAAPALIRAIVAEWSSEVLPAIDERIVRCHELVKRGLRDEAVGYAMEPPDLFEAVNLLDLERFGKDNYAAWQEASQAAGLMLPPPPQLDKVGDIVGARDRVAELRPLLEQWRRLNIQRAPLPSRIRMLLELLGRDSDPNNQVWHAMLVDHEKHRLMEIKASIGRLREQCARDRDVDASSVERDVEGFLRELQGEWRTLQPPANLSEQATLLVAEVRQRRIDATLDGLVSVLESAHARLETNRPAAKEELYRRVDAWKTALADRGVIDPADPRLARVGHIIEYVERLREHDALVAEVSQRVAEQPTSLLSRISWSQDLDRMMDRIDDTASRLPAADIDPRRIGDLSDRVARVAEAVRREIYLWRLVRVSAVAAMLLVAATATWALYSLRQHTAGVRAALEQCAAAVKKIESGEPAAADLGDKWNDAVRRNPEVTKARERVTAAQKAQDDRRESFAKRLKDIRGALAELQAAGRPDPLTPWPVPFTRASKLLTELRNEKLATVDDERAKLEQPAATLRTNAREFGVAADDAFDDRVRRLEAELSAAEIELVDDPVKADSAIAKATADLDSLRVIAGTPACPAAGEDYGLRKLVSASAAALVAADSKAASRLNTLRTRRAVIAGLADREQSSDRLLAGGKHAEYADAIRQIAKDIGPGPIARDYTAVADNHTAWHGIAEWNRFVAELRNPTGFTAEEANAVLEKMKALTPETKRLPDAVAADRWLTPALQRMQTRTSDNLKTLREEIVKRLDSMYGEAIDGVVTEKDVTDYPRYYCLLKHRPLPDMKKRFSYVTGLPDAAKEWPMKQLSFDPEAHSVTDSPQKRLAVAGKKVIERETTAGAAAIDVLALEVIQACAAPPKPAAGDLPIDPCLHSMLLRFLVDQACKGSPTLTEGFTKSLAIINSGNAPNGTAIMIKGVDNEVFAAVLDPEKQNAGAWVQAQRVKCADFVERVARDADATFQSITAQTMKLNAHYHDLRQFRCVGRLRKLPEGGWTISGGDAALRAGKQIFTVGGARDSFKLLPCATCNDKGNIPTGTDVNARAGEPLYIEISNDRTD
jgi:Tfp pilus assembly protein PilE